MTEIRINLDDYRPEIAAKILAALSDALVGGGKKPTFSLDKPSESHSEGTPTDDPPWEPSEEHIPLATVRDAVHQYSLNKGKPAVKALLADHRITRLTEADANCLDRIYKAVTANG